jgi:ADP-ribosyl-[dinitrogen reductase] hydrolase
MDWHHLPIPDYGSPDSIFEDRWIYSGNRLRPSLRAGKKVVIHCKGGLGRSGTIAARLLVELGVKPAAAIREVRAARHGAIENRAQEYHVGSSKPMASDPVLLDRILGCLLGGAVGDALGYEVEFDGWSAIRKRFGANGITEPQAHAGKFRESDDTQTTPFTLEGMLQSGQLIKPPEIEPIVESIRRCYADWLRKQGEKAPGWERAGAIWQDTGLNHRQAPGNTCLDACSRVLAGRRNHSPATLL